MEKVLNKFFLGVMLTVLIVALVACGGSGQQTNTNQNSSPPANEAKDAKPEENKEAKSNFPERPINIVVGFGAGGGTDVLSRAVVELAQKYVPNNGTIAVVNQPGAGGVIAAAEVMNANPDGYNLLISPSGPLTLTPHFGDTPFKDLSGLTPIINLTTDSYFLAVKGDSPFETFEDLVEYAKTNDMNFGTAGARSVSSVAMASLALDLGVNFVEVPFEGNAPARAALLGGHVHAIHSVETDVLPYAESGELRPLLYFGYERHPAHPDVPSVKDLGFNAFTNSFFMIGPKDLPADIRDALHDIFKQAMEDPAAEETFKKIMATPDYRNGDHLLELLQSKYDVNKQVVEESGLANN